MHSPYTYIDHAEDLGRLTEALRKVERVGLDTEADSLHHYFEKVCLIQLSFSGRNYIVDPLAGMPFEAFLEVLSQKALILQGADYDLRMMKKSFNFRPKAPVFDTMLAAQVLGYEKIGLAALAEKFCGAVLSKAGQKSDWAKRPLLKKQLDYAADDTRYLEAIADAMTRELQAMGRTGWHRECCERVVETAGLAKNENTRDTWRIKGSHKMTPRELAFLRELWKWRDEEARRRDRPAFMILQNEELIELVRGQSKDPREPLQPGPKFMKRVTGDFLTRLKEVLGYAENLPVSEWPPPPERARFLEKQPSSEKLEALMNGCKTIAAQLKIESCFLAPRAILTDLARHVPRSVEEAMESCGMMRWQAELLMPVIRDVFGQV